MQRTYQKKSDLLVALCSVEHLWPKHTKFELQKIPLRLQFYQEFYNKVIICAFVQSQTLCADLHGWLMADDLTSFTTKA